MWVAKICINKLLHVKLFIMKAFQEYIETGNTNSIRILHFEQTDSEMPWHFHQEIEIVYFPKGLGRVCVNDFFESFNAGDILLIGSNIPHVYLYGKSYEKQKIPSITAAYVIQFSSELFNSQTLQLPEFQNIKTLFEKMKYGLKIKQKWRKEFAEKIKQLSECEGVFQITCLIELLESIAKSGSYKLISNNLPTETNVSDQKVRLQKLINFLQSNYNQEIRLDDVAKKANMNKSAFCRYFQQHFRKTFTEYLNELRIGYACKLLVNNKLSVSEIGFQVGYNNISYFIRQFRKQHNVSPLEYRKNYKISD